MSTVNYTVNQFALVDEKNEALTQLLADFSWQDEPLLKLSLPLFPQIEAISSIDELTTIDAFRHNLVDQLKQLKTQGLQLNLSPKILDKLSFMWAAFFDERVIYESPIDTVQWENNTLVSQLFGIRNSGETFFTLIKRLMGEPSQNLELLQLSYILLQLGFKGKYHDKRTIELNQTIAEINHVLSEFGALPTNKSQLSAYSTSVKKPYRVLLKRGLNPTLFWLFCIMACIAAAIIYQQKLTEVYTDQQSEYQLMADETGDYLKSIQPKVHYVEQKDFISQDIFQPALQPESSQKIEQNFPKQAVSQPLPKTSAVEPKPTVYLVQLAIYDVDTTVQLLINRCANDTYPPQQGVINGRTYVGYLANGYQQAKRVSNFYQEYCQLVPYIKEYK